MAIEAILWDFGGVFTSSPFEAFNRYEARRGLPKDFIRKVNSTNHECNAWALFECSRIDAQEFDLKFLEESTALGYPLRGADILPLLSGELRPRMVAALRTCKQRYKIGCITNNVVHPNGPAMAANPDAAAPRGGKVDRVQAHPVLADQPELRHTREDFIVQNLQTGDRHAVTAQEVDEVLPRERSLCLVESCSGVLGDQLGPQYQVVRKRVRGHSNGRWTRHFKLASRHQGVVSKCWRVVNG